MEVCFQWFALIRREIAEHFPGTKDKSLASSYPRYKNRCQALTEDFTPEDVPPTEMIVNLGWKIENTASGRGKGEIQESGCIDGEIGGRLPEFGKEKGMD